MSIDAKHKTVAELRKMKEDEEMNELMEKAGSV
jgi:hypothetical protein